MLRKSLIQATGLFRESPRSRPARFSAPSKNSTENSSAAGKAPARKLRVCLAASGGGHLRQLLDLESVSSTHDAFYLTEDTPFSRSLTCNRRIHFVSHYAVGQAKQGLTFRMLLAAMRNFFQSLRIVLQEKPDVFISTGAGSVFFGLILAKLLGAKIILIESFARFNHLSLFARGAAPFADYKVVQSTALLKYWPDAAVFDPLRILDTPVAAKKSFLFGTVGASFPFDRLVETVATLKGSGAISEDVLIQTGRRSTCLPGIRTVESLPFEQMLSTLAVASIVVCHGGTGSIITALRHGCHVIVMPREAAKGEHYDSHQEDITNAFEARGLVAVAHTAEELTSALKQVRATPATVATSDPAQLIRYLTALLSKWTDSSFHNSKN